MYLPVVPVGQAAAFRTNHAFVPSPPEGFRILERPARHVTVCPIVGLAVVLSLTRCLAAPGDVDPSFAPGASVDYAVLAVTAQVGGKVLIGGAFTSVQGTARGGIARLNDDGTLDTTFLNGLSGADNFVWCVAGQSDGKVLIGGFFSSVNGAARNSIARLNTDGTLDTGFLNGLSGANGAVYSAALQSDGKIVLGGNFTSVNGVARNYVARLNADGTLDTGFLNGLTGGDTALFSLAVQTNSQILIGGWFTSINGVGRNHLARLNPDGTLDNAFLKGMSATDGRVWTVAVQGDGKILIGGDFTTVNGVGRNGLARLNGDGSLDDAFLNGLAGANGPVWSLAAQADGKIVVGGQFSTINGTTRNAVARLNGDGTLDSSFLNGRAGADNSARSVAIQGDGKILIGGQFNFVNLVVSDYVARLLAIWPPPLIHNGRFVNSQFAFNLSGASGQVVVVLASADLHSWIPIGTNTLSSTPTLFTDLQSPASGRRFYRAMTP